MLKIKIYTQKKSFKVHTHMKKGGLFFNSTNHFQSRCVVDVRPPPLHLHDLRRRLLQLHLQPFRSVWEMVSATENEKDIGFSFFEMLVFLQDFLIDVSWLLVTSLLTLNVRGFRPFRSLPLLYFLISTWILIWTVFEGMVNEIFLLETSTSSGTS